ncbi:hypothetical protein ADK78_05640 [Kitasatospora aureofaciens]|nr:hypothetical protein DF17_04700 [Streptomyces rimosus]KOG80122.1 hypothetical protein ADK78_05640 [Kitasatospora aureofaciens]KOT43867.1 hypothetical protein ADK84_07530 [Streptomyces sp. NRRL WC-3701]KOT58579.1 hypothetical protein ADK44_19935 [Streptomyces rimosus subsp. rimosus]KOT65985.1 hypothetical protein ADK45_11270 [Streptomyces rimosus subsp. rimosus]
MTRTWGPWCRAHASRTWAALTPWGAGDGAHLPAVVGGRAPFASGAGDRAERHERDALLTAVAQELLLLGRCAHPVHVLYADHRCDGPGLGEVVGADVGQAQVADEAGRAQFGECAEAFGDGIDADDAQVHHVQVVAAELARVLLRV